MENCREMRNINQAINSWDYANEMPGAFVSQNSCPPSKDALSTPSSDQEPLASAVGLLLKGYPARQHWQGGLAQTAKATASQRAAEETENMWDAKSKNCVIPANVLSPHLPATAPCSSFPPAGSNSGGEKQK